jgi:hypothetical protein
MRAPRSCIRGGTHHGAAHASCRVAAQMLNQQASVTARLEHGDRRQRRLRALVVAAAETAEGVAAPAGPPVEYLGYPGPRTLSDAGTGNPPRRSRRTGPGPARGSRGGAPRRGGAQGPQGPAPGIPRFGSAAPPAVTAELAAELPVRRLSLGKEVKVAAAQGDELGGRRRFAADYRQAAGSVIDAVAVPVPGNDPVSTRDHADGIGQPLEVPERHHGIDENFMRIRRLAGRPRVPAGVPTSG